MNTVLDFLNFDLPFFGRTASQEDTLKLRAQKRMKEILNRHTQPPPDPQLEALLKEISISQSAQERIQEQAQDFVIDPAPISADTILPPESQTVSQTIDEVIRPTIVPDPISIAPTPVEPSVQDVLPSIDPPLVVEVDTIGREAINAIEIPTNITDVPTCTIEAPPNITDVPPSISEVRPSIPEVTPTIPEVPSTIPEVPVQPAIDTSISSDLTNNDSILNAAAQSTSKAKATKKAPSSFTATLASAALNNLKFVLPFIPFLGWVLYSSKQKIATNINVNITAPLEKKAYQITFAKGDTSISVAFEAASGQPVRFLREASKDDGSPSDSISLFNTHKNSLSVSLLGPLYSLVWKRKEHYASCNIIINEPFANESLEKGPSIKSIPISDIESINIIHRLYRINKNPAKAALSTADAVEDADDWITREITIDAGTKNKPKHIPIPPLDEDDSGTKEFIRIEQGEVTE